MAGAENPGAAHVPGAAPGFLDGHDLRDLGLRSCIRILGNSHGSTEIRSALRDSVRKGWWVAPAPEPVQRAPGAEAALAAPGAEVRPIFSPRLVASTDHAPAPKVAGTRH